MSENWQGSTGEKKRAFDDFDDDFQMQDPSIVTPTAKKTRFEISSTDTADEVTFGNDSWFDEFVDYVDDPDMQAVLAMPQPAEKTVSAQAVPPVDQPAETNGLVTNIENAAQVTANFEYALPEIPELLPAWILDDDDTLMSEQQVMTTSVLDLIDGDELSLFTVDDVNKEYNHSTTLEDSQVPLDTGGWVTPAIQEYDSDIEGHRLISLTQRPSPTQVQRKSQRGPTNKPPEIEGFPKSEEPLPANLTLDQMCWYYPNHLQGENLRRFLRADWNGKMIWDAMQEAAKKTSSKLQGSNKMTKRMTKQRDLMTLEAAKASQNSSQGGGMANDMGSEDFEVFPQQPLVFETLAVPVTPISASLTFDPKMNSDKMVEPLLTENELDSKIQDELQEQVNIISRILFCREPNWLSTSSEAQASRVDDTWLAKARETEASLIRENLVDTEGIPSDQNSKEGLLNRLCGLLSRILLATDSRKNEASEEEIAAFWDPRQPHVQRLILKNELTILQHWTETFKQDLEQAEKILFEGDMHAYLQGEVTADQSQIPVPAAANKTRRRGNRQPSPMFPFAPSPGIPLSDQDIGDPDKVLENYPEHLTLHRVMEPFLRPFGRQSGGYPIRLMVEKLRHHHNAQHGSDLNAEGRDEALTVWVKTFREHARRARRNTQKQV